MGGQPHGFTYAATVTRITETAYKASYGDGTYAGVFASARAAQATIERSISPGAAPLNWRQQDRLDAIEVWYVLRDKDGNLVA